MMKKKKLYTEKAFIKEAKNKKKKRRNLA